MSEEKDENTEDCRCIAEAVKRTSDSGEMGDSSAKRLCLEAVEEKGTAPDGEISDEKAAGEHCSEDGIGEADVEVKYEYLDHTADIQIHSWGNTLAEAFEQGVVAMAGYQTEVDTIDMTSTETVTAEGEDLLSLLYHLLDEFLFLFAAEPFFVTRQVKIKEFDRENWRIVAEGFGETFDLAKHPQGTEVKAITYSNMQIYDSEGKHECYFILDI